MFSSTLPSPPPSSLRDLPQHAALRSIVLMRLVALCCLLVTIAISTVLLGIELPLYPLFTVMATLTAISAWTWWRMRQPGAVSSTMLFLHLLIDICALSIMLYFCGGATNPFVSFYLPALAVAAALLPWGQSLLLSILAIIAYSLLTTYFEPIRMGNADRAISYHLAGMWANFSFSAALITWFVTALSRTVRQRDRQLAQARERFLENDRLAALGIQAANAAHEMGTPLSTLAIIIGDLRSESGKTAAMSTLQTYRDDIATMEAQIALCKLALDRMGKQATPGISDIPVSVRQWLQQFSDEWRLRYPAVPFELRMPDDDRKITASIALEQILTTLLDNAAQAVTSPGKPICLQLLFDAKQISFEVIDNGPGIPPELLPRLGHEPITQGNRGNGIGLFLAFATARQIGASIELTPAHSGGTRAYLKMSIT